MENFKDDLMMIIYPLGLFLLLASLIGCGPYVKQPVASHIVAVTITGDTILVAIDKIRPNMYRSYYPIYSSYNYYRPNYHYSQQEYQFRYSDNRGTRGSSGSSSSSGNSSGGGKIIPREKPPTPDIQVRPSGTTLLKTKT